MACANFKRRYSFLNKKQATTKPFTEDSQRGNTHVPRGSASKVPSVINTVIPVTLLQTRLCSHKKESSRQRKVFLLHPIYIHRCMHAPHTHTHTHRNAIHIFLFENKPKCGNDPNVT
jgi:hypothetical protein